MKQLIIILLIFNLQFSIFNLQLKAQTIKYGNEWINPEQSYYKIKVAKTGIYRIEYTDMVNAGVDFISENPKYIQLFYRGVEQAIYIKGENDLTFDSIDYIEFYGEMNDGTQDSALYVPASSQPHKYYSLFSDTSAYFLTWKNGVLTNRMKIENIPPALSPENYHLAEKLLVLTNSYESTHKTLNSSLAQWELAEGWFSVAVGQNSTNDFELAPVTNVYTGGVQQPVIEILLIGRNSNTHNVILSGSISPTGTFKQIQAVQFGGGFRTKLVTMQLDTADISGTGEYYVRMLVLGLNGETDRVSIAYIKLTYPQTFEMNNDLSKYFNLPGTKKSVVEIKNAPANIILYDITDKNNIKRIGGFWGTNFKAIVDSTGKSARLFANAASNYTKPTSINAVSFNPIIPVDYDYIIITHKKLISAALDYAAWRSSINGGSFKPLTIDVDHLYDQFGYGEYGPVGIKRFIQYMYDGNPDSLEHIFIIGKGLVVNYFYDSSNVDVYYRKNRISAPVKELIPTAGLPGSDLMFTMGLDGLQDVPTIPIGRLSAQAQQDVINYLDKVKEHESFGYDDLWRKRILHLAGGKNKGEQDFFIGALTVQKDIAEGIYLGASVKTILKSSPDIQLFDITKDVNDGLLLIQFFGHSSTGTSEIDIGDINNPIMKYNNKGKYPMIIMNGCYAGLIYVGGSLGEDWLLAKDKGAVLFLAHSHLGFTIPLNAYTQKFYNIAFANSIFWGKSIGEIHKETISEFRYGPFGNTILYRAHAQEINLQGDPAIKLFGAYKPDLYTNDDQLFIHSYDGEPVTAVSDSFAIGIIASNFGKAIPDSFYITIERTFADGSQIIYDTLLYPAVFTQDTLFFMIKSKDPNNFGLNKFKVFLDYTNTIDELNEFNNTGVIEYYMPSSGVMTLFPKEYSIVNSLPITFVAQPATDLLKGYSYYVFQLDTINTFDSPMKKDSTLYSGIIAKWITYPKFNVEDSTVFYWRVRFRDIPAGEDTLWAESSFIYIPGSPEGWSQSHFPQFSKAALVNIERDSSIRRWEFVKNTVDIKLQTYGNKMPDSTELTLNDKLKISVGCPINGLLAVTFDKKTAFPFNADQGNYCGFIEPYLLRKLVNLSNPADFNNYFNSIDDSTYILIFSKGDAQYSTWPLEIFISLLNIGASSIVYQLKDGEPYILLGIKGAGYGNAPLEVIADTSSGFPLDSQKMSIAISLIGSFYNGTITSTIIGPSSHWGTLYHTYKKPETSDNFRLQIFGIDLSNKQYSLHPDVTNDSLDLSWIEPNVYPYLRLQATVSDIINSTPPQLKKWQVIYNGVAEGIINPEIIGIDKYNITDKREGEIFDVNFAFQNISDKNFDDTLTVIYTLTNHKTRKQAKTISTLTTLKADSTLFFSHSINTLGLAGDNDLNVYVNPKILPEQYYSNNILQFPFKVLKDNTHPVLDVTFDGIHIMDGDIVSPSPVISISLKDENKYLLKTDTLGIEIFLKEPDAELFRRVYFSGPEDISWVPAGANNKFKIDYSPENEDKMYLTEKKPLEDGIYTLRVEGADVTGNESGVNPYRINFNVINESTITYFYPYPNPFSTCTRFVFTLTGNDIPDEIKIQIMTVTGKVVREILQDELGALRIGNNITDFQWCGTDEFGDKLANGVYLYRVFARSNGEDIRHRNTVADRGFKRNFGKLYILR